MKQILEFQTEVIWNFFTFKVPMIDERKSDCDTNILAFEWKVPTYLEDFREPNFAYLLIY